MSEFTNMPITDALYGEGARQRAKAVPRPIREPDPHKTFVAEQLEERIINRLYKLRRKLKRV